MEEEGCQRRKWVGRHGDAFADIFVAHTGIHIPTLHEMCRETLNPHIGTGTSNFNVQVVVVSSLFMTFILLPCCFGEPLGDVTLRMRMCGNYRYLTTRCDYPPK